MKKLLSLALCLMLLVGSLAAFAETYTGEAEGFSNATPIKVSVTVVDGKITEVKVDDHGESVDDIAAVPVALETIPQAIVAANNADVDGVAGATWTSKGIVAAVKKALEGVELAAAPAADEAGALAGEAEGMHGPVKVEVTVTEGKITDVKVTDHQEHPDYGVPAVEQLPAKIVEANSAEVDVIAGSTFTSKAIVEAVKKALEGVELTAAPAAEVPLDSDAALVNGTFTGEAEGFSSAKPIKVSVTFVDGKITEVKVDDHGESVDDIAAVPVALETIPQAIVAANNADVDIVAGATWTSKGIIAAVKAAMAQAGIGGEEASAAPAQPVSISGTGLTVGLGVNNTGRIGPGKDDKEVQVYSFNQVFAGVFFDADGKIVYAKLDQLEVASPNYDGEGMPHFAGFPGQLPYTYDENHDGKIDGVLETNNDAFQADLAAWQTKRERGDGYKMGLGTWADQMNAYEAFFVGKTVEELEAIFERTFSSRNGRPLKDGSTNEEDKAKYDALSGEDKALLADVTSGATMSLNDSHGNILAALKSAYETRVPLAASAAAVGLGLDISGRIGPGKDSTDTQVYSFNQVIALNLFDAEGKIVQSVVDQIEVATPNYDGEGMPHFSGFPAQGGYNYDTNHDGVIDGRLITNAEGFQAEIASWMTKRARGNDYKMGLGTWASEMDAFQTFFTGKTVDELDELFARVFSSRNGRPLKDGSTNEEDKAKYDALSDEDKALLADVVSGATMSLNDSHGNILAALRNSLDNKVAVSMEVGE